MGRLLERLDALDDRVVPGYPRDNPPLRATLVGTIGIAIGFALAHFVRPWAGLVIIAAVGAASYGVRTWRRRQRI